MTAIALDPQLLNDIEGAVNAAVRHYMRRGAPAPVSDMRQEAWRIAMRAATTVKAGGNSKGYFYTAIRRSLGAEVSRWLAVPSIHGAVDEARHVQQRCTLTDVSIARGDDQEGPGEVVDALIDRRSPEVLLLAREVEQVRERLRVAFQANVYRLLADWPGRDVRAVKRVFGIDGAPPQRPACVARALKVSRQSVYRVVGKFRQAVSEDPTSFGLLKRLREVQGP